MASTIAAPHASKRPEKVLDLLLFGLTGLIAIVVGVVASGYVTADTYVTTFGAGVSPRLSPEKVVAMVQDEFAEMRQAGGGATPVDIESLTADTGAALASQGLAESIQSGVSSDNKMYWWVWAKGPFFLQHAPPGEPYPSGSRGFFVIDDADGSVVGKGIPR
jgi:hypothetical protein